MSGSGKKPVLPTDLAAQIKAGKKKTGSQSASASAEGQDTQSTFIKRSFDALSSAKAQLNLSEAIKNRIEAYRKSKAYNKLAAKTDLTVAEIQAGAALLNEAVTYLKEEKKITVEALAKEDPSLARFFREAATGKWKQLFGKSTTEGDVIVGDISRPTGPKIFNKLTGEMVPMPTIPQGAIPMIRHKLEQPAVYEPTAYKKQVPPPLPPAVLERRAKAEAEAKAKQQAEQQAEQKQKQQEQVRPLPPLPKQLSNANLKPAHTLDRSAPKIPARPVVGNAPILTAKQKEEAKKRQGGRFAPVVPEQPKGGKREDSSWIKDKKKGPKE